MTPLKPQLSIIITVDTGGRNFHNTLKSISRSISFADKSALTTEVIIVTNQLNNAQKLAVEVSARHQLLDNSFKLMSINKHSTEAKLNEVVASATGEYITIVAGGDLISQNWLVASVEKLKNVHKTVVHPRYIISFDGNDRVWDIPSSTSKKFHPHGLAEANYWGGVITTTKKILLEHPRQVRPTDVGEWLWNCQTLGRGMDHVTAPKTTYFHRFRQRHKLGEKQNDLLPATAYLAPNTQRPVRFESKKKISKRKKLFKRGVLFVARSFARLVFLVTTPLRFVHPRLADYTPRLMGETFHLLRSPGLADDKESPLPQWLLAEWSEMNEVEHMIYPAPHRLQYPIASVDTSSDFSRVYWYLADNIGLSCTHLFLVPWLKKGGGDLEILNFTEGILRLDSKARIVVLATEVDESPWAERLDRRVRFLSMPKEFTNISHDQQEKLIATLCIQTKPKRIHLINSYVGYRAFDRYAKALTKNSKLFITLFCVDFTPQGDRAHYFLDYVKDNIKYVSKVLTDNKAVIEEVHDLQGLPKSRFQTIYHPSSLVLASRKYNQRPGLEDGLSILWAGRFGHQKRLDILLAIARETRRQKLPVQFYVYGGTRDTNDSVSLLKKSKEIHYCGEYDGGLASLDLDRFDAFLLNSKWEGLPNVLLEATGGGLPVIAPDVGGVSELIKSKKTGYLVPDYKNVRQYAAVFKRILRHPEELEGLVTNAQKLVAARHTWSHFIDDLKIIEGYIDSNEAKK